MQKYLKALFAALFTAIGATQTAYVSSHGHIGVVAGLTIAGSTLASLAVVWGVPNKSDVPPAPPAA